MIENVHIRVATPADAQALLAIYRPYVEDTAVTFEAADAVPTADEFRTRIVSTLERFPWLVAERDGVPCGYAYAHQFKERAAYAWTVEPSIYIAPGAQGCGIGRALYEELERILAAQGVQTCIACIACTDRADDPYLTDASIRFHERMGYEPAGHFSRCGYKFGRWYDMCWMQKQIGDYPADISPIAPFCDWLCK